MLWHKIQGAGGAGGGMTLDFVAQSYGNYPSSSTSVVFGATPQANDILLVYIGDWAETTGISYTPSGWTRIALQSAPPWYSSPAYRTLGALYYKVASGSEGTSVSGFYFGNNGVGTSPQFATQIYRPSASFSTATVVGAASGTPLANGTISSGSATGHLAILPVYAQTVGHGVDLTNYTTASPTATTDQQVPRLSYTNLQLMTWAMSAGEETNISLTAGQGGTQGSMYIRCYIKLA